MTEVEYRTVINGRWENLVRRFATSDAAADFIDAMRRSGTRPENIWINA